MVFVTGILVALGGPVAADEPPTPRDIVERGVAAHGGNVWLEPGTLTLSGEATFFAPDGTAPRSHADDYRMWRVMNPDRDSAHGAEGKVRITAKAGERILFEVGYDGETTWNERGIVPKAEADAFWASNFGFGIIRSALGEGFTLESAPPREIGGRAVDLVRVIDPQGSATLFGFDAESGFIRYLAFRSPRGWHERLYDDFVKLDNGWVQARSVTLLYDGTVSNIVRWTETRVGEPIDPAIFAPPVE
ncbi:hypothetical protein [Erythrobacter sp. JK5]|uniref:hypothetical protein n=1 Tax=Erythrobacter sp. JK5 TaxID=2829500 RepID=UPI001BA7B941|nr:hypothetical protein [Erythrobacter sp. JK5]QUL36952.1 hypothetical protein KDC96_11140 [Erythrobacter sp. JK5]